MAKSDDARTLIREAAIRDTLNTYREWAGMDLSDTETMEHLLLNLMIYCRVNKIDFAGVVTRTAKECERASLDG